MSHTAKIKPMFFDESAVIAAAKEMGAEIVRGKLNLYESGSTVENGFGVKLPGWQYPVIIDCQTGEASYDNFNGHWGEAAHLTQFKKLYAACKLTADYQRKGWLVSRSVKPTGEIKLQITGHA